MRNDATLITHSETVAGLHGKTTRTEDAPVSIKIQWLGVIESPGIEDDVLGEAEAAIVRTRYMSAIRIGSIIIYKDRRWQVIRVAPEGEQYRPKNIRLVVESIGAR